MEVCGNEEIDDINKNNMHEVGDTGIYYEEEDKSTDTDNEDIIHRDINVN